MFKWVVQTNRGNDYYPSRSRKNREKILFFFFFYLLEIFFLIFQVTQQVVQVPPISYVDMGRWISNVLYIGDSCGQYFNMENFKPHFSPYENVEFSGFPAKILRNFNQEPLTFLCSTFELYLAFRFPIYAEKIIFHFREPHHKYEDNYKYSASKLNIHVTPTIQFEPRETSWKFMGCFRDDQKFREMDKFMGNFRSNLTPTLCARICKGTKVVGLQAGFECWCGEKYGKVEKLGDGNCTKCPGDPEFSCGAEWINSIYERDVLHLGSSHVTNLREELEKGEYKIAVDLSVVKPFDFFPVKVELFGEKKWNGIILEKISFEGAVFPDTT
jgi:hypothetical protein